VQRLAKRTGVPVAFVAGHGKGSHGTLYYGSRLTVVKDLKKELSESLLHDMCRHLGIDKRDLF
jgi:mRNA interferase HicA